MNPSRRALFRGIARGDLKQATVARRPPWALAEAEFVTRCTRCDACIAACPEQLLARGDGGFPEIAFTRAGCDYCGKCAAACAAQALDRVAVDTAFPWVAEIGATCLSQRGVECRICGDACAPRAIRFRPAVRAAARPELDPARCDGCGFCLSVCPEHAITLRVAERAIPPVTVES
ncbi:MAG: ferredoxin-type protein NapF [Chromatiales bacterium]|nr:ferredoxin-type protein NapF [Gammaproteobacteria bacterium]MCP5352978.1 ferredoxin-type protein NapF [Chromatiales bacterium]